MQRLITRYFYEEKKTKHIDNSDEEGITKQISATFIHEHSKEGLKIYPPRDHKAFSLDMFRVFMCVCTPI
jgi:hypothetical protein